MSGVGRDVKHALGMLTRYRGFAAAVLVTMALGVGGTSAVFSVVYSVLLQPLPYPESERLVRLWEEHRGARAPVDQPLLTNGTYHSLASVSTTLAGVGAFDAGIYTVANAGLVDRLRGVRVTPSLFHVLQVAAAHGRLFDEADAAAGAPKVVVLTHATWRSRFGGGHVLDTWLTLNGEDHRIVGIAPAGFAFPGPEAARPSDDRRPVSFYTPMAMPGIDGFDIAETIVGSRRAPRPRRQRPRVRRWHAPSSVRRWLTSSSAGADPSTFVHVCCSSRPRSASGRLCWC